MIFIFLCLFSGLIGGMVSLYFRMREIKEEIILFPRHLASQIALFVIFALIFREYFSQVFIDLGFIKLGWFLIYIVFSSLSFYAVQVFYEFFSGNTFFASEEEMKKFIEKLESENRD